MQIIFESKEEIQQLSDALQEIFPAALCITAEDLTDVGTRVNATFDLPLIPQKLTPKDGKEHRKRHASDYDSRLLGAVFSRVRSGTLSMQDAMEIAAVDEAEAEPLYKIWELLEWKQQV